MSSVSEARLALSTAQALREQDAVASLAAFEGAVSLAAGANARELQADAEFGWGLALFSFEDRKLESLPHFERATVLGAGSVIEAVSWLTIADILATKDPDRALAAYTKAAKLFENLSDPFGAGSAHLACAQLLQSLQRDEEALPELYSAIKFALQDNAAPVVAQLYLDSGELLLRLDRKMEASLALTEAEELFRALENWRLETRACMHLLSLANEVNDHSECTRLQIRLAELAVKRMEQEGDPQLEGKANLLLARLLEEQEESEGNSDD